MAAHGRALRVLELTGVDKLCDPPDVDLPATPGTDRTVETLLRARRHCESDGASQNLRQLAIAEMYDMATAMARSSAGSGRLVAPSRTVTGTGLP